MTGVQELPTYQHLESGSASKCRTRGILLRKKVMIGRLNAIAANNDPSHV
jgi:hypothetical protein